VAQTLTRTAAATASSTITSATIAGASTLTRTSVAAAQQALTQTVALLGLPTPTPFAVAPTATPTPAAIATPTPLAVYTVRRGDTLFEIAGQYDMSVDDLLAANGLTENDVYTIQPGDELKIPAPTPEGAPTASSTEGESATATPAPETYTVRGGDTILAIALRNNVSVEDMLAANGLTINDARTLQPGDELIIPGPEGIPTATPAATATGAPTGTSTATPAATVTGVPTPTPTTASVVRVDAPRLRSPENGTAVSCSGQETLTWLQVPSVRPTDLYLVHLGYVNGVAADGSEEVVWVISQQRPVSATSWQLDNNLCGLAPNNAGKQWRWYVEVAESAADGMQPVSPASPVWGFAWQ
jgi:LysM repeat protein